MKKIIFLILILVSTPIALAIDNYNTYESLTMETSISNVMFLEGTGLEYLTAELHLNPQEDERQNIIQKQISSNPQAQITDDETIMYRWNTQTSEYSLGLDAKIETINTMYGISTINFPYQDLPEEFEQHLREQDIIDITPEIIAKASEIVGSEDNAYLAVHKIGYWVRNNIEYELDTLTENAAKEASWVLENRYGVCDEISVLFISMLRSIGIPARFVSGAAYTNVGNDFGNHGWAEVYYPGYGWVPYDITYGQFGWIDPTHLALSKSIDAGETTIRYQWRATNADITPGEILIDTEITSPGGEMDPIFRIRVRALEDELGPGSYVPIKVTIENPKNKHHSTQVSITKAPDLVGENNEVVALRPNEQKQIFWIARGPQTIPEGYIYTSTIEAKDQFGSVDQDEVAFTSTGQVLSLQEAEDIINEYKEEQEDTYSDTVFLSCKPEKEYYYSYEQATIECTARSIANPLNNLDLCLNEVDCQDFSLGALEEQTLTFSSPSTNLQETSKITLTSTNLNLVRHLTLKVYDEPNIQILELDYPEIIDYNNDMTLGFEVYSPTQIKNAKIKIDSLQYLDIGDFEGKKPISIGFNSKALLFERIDMKLKYQDESGKDYTQEFQFPIKVNKIPWYFKIYRTIMSIFD